MVAHQNNLYQIDAQAKNQPLNLINFLTFKKEKNTRLNLHDEPQKEN